MILVVSGRNVEGAIKCPEIWNAPYVRRIGIVDEAEYLGWQRQLLVQDLRVDRIVGRHDDQMRAAVRIDEISYESHVVLITLAIERIHPLGPKQGRKAGMGVTPPPPGGAPDEVWGRVERTDVVVPEGTSECRSMEVAHLLHAVFHERMGLVPGRNASQKNTIAVRAAPADILPIPPTESIAKSP